MTVTCVRKNYIQVSCMHIDTLEKRHSVFSAHQDIEERSVSFLSSEHASLTAWALREDTETWGAPAMRNLFIFMTRINHPGRTKSSILMVIIIHGFQPSTHWSLGITRKVCLLKGARNQVIETVSILHFPISQQLVGL